jgi:predicted nuclease with TOPRIM domain
MKNTIDKTSTEYTNMLDLQALVSDCTNRLKELEAEVNNELLSEIDSRRADYAQLQESISKAEQSLELIALKHPEWFGDKQSLKTLYGSLKFQKSTCLDVVNAELSLALIDAEAAANKEFNAAHYTRTKRELNLDALSALDDATLAKFRIKRVEKSNFSVVPVKVDLGKAVKEATERKAA